MRTSICQIFGRPRRLCPSNSNPTIKCSFSNGRRTATTVSKPSRTKSKPACCEKPCSGGGRDNHVQAEAETGHPSCHCDKPCKNDECHILKCIESTADFPLVRTKSPSPMQCFMCEIMSAAWVCARRGGAYAIAKNSVLPKQI